MNSYIYKFFIFIILMLDLTMTPSHVIAKDLHVDDPMQEKIDRKRLDKFQEIVSDQAKPFADVKFSAPIRIAVIYPSTDISDFWVRNYTAMTKRLTALEIPFEVDEYTSKQIEHSLQTQHTQTVLNAEEKYDFVIFGPSELALQTENIQKLAASKAFKTFIWAFHTPNPNWKYQPDAWFDFSSAMGAEALCNYVVRRMGDNVNFAVNRGIPGITDTQRSQGFIDCVEEKADWLSMYEHFGQYQKRGGADGAKLFLDNFPEVSMIHNANTAMTMGAVDFLRKANKLSNIFVTGWGGTAKEIEKIKLGELNATPMRMSDDLGVATAESIKFNIAKRASDVPLIYLGRIIVVNSDMSETELNTFTHEAFRYSGIK